jgi:ribonuclease J
MNKELELLEEPLVKEPEKIDFSSMRVFALGGLEEIGKNTYVVEEENDIVILDAGVKFPSAGMLGIDAIVPDYSYLKENKHKIKGLFITHGHEDHIGGIPYLLNQVSIPFIYAPYLAAGLIREKIKSKNFRNKTKIITIDNSSVIKTINFTISFFPVNHSIPDSFGIRVEGKNGTVVSTGDYKFD